MKLITHGEELSGLVDELATVYRGAFGAPGDGESERDFERFRDEQFPVHAGREGFRCAVAVDEGTCVGFAYGYTGRRGQWWTDQVAARAPADVVERWLDGHFEFVELAVDPPAQRRGHGAALHDALLRSVPNSRALLTTYRDDRPAPRLYRRLGWELLVEGIFEDGDLYGLDLRRWSQGLER